MSQPHPLHTDDDFLKFLRKLDRECPKGTPVQVILPGYRLEDHPEVRGWLNKHPRFTLSEREGVPA